MLFDGVGSISCKLRVTVGDLGVASIDGALENNRIINRNATDLKHIPNCAFTSLPLLKAGILEIPINDKDKVPFGKETATPECRAS